MAVWAGLVAGLTEPADLTALAVIAGVVVLWGHTVAGAVGRGRAWVPLLVLGAALSTGALTTAWAGPAGGLLGEWLESANIPALQGVSADRALLLVGVFLVQLSTGNVIVRLVLAATDTTDPTYGSEPDDPSSDSRADACWGRWSGCSSSASASAGTSSPPAS